MRNHVAQFYPLEACGLLAGRRGCVERVIPINNILMSPSRYLMNPQQQLQVFNDLEANGQELLAIYHSHPDGPAYPSKTDISQAYYPDAYYIIWNQIDSRWDCHAFQIINGKVNKIKLRITPD